MQSVVILVISANWKYAGKMPAETGILFGWMMAISVTGQGHFKGSNYA